MGPELKPIDPELERLLDVERSASPPAEALDRVWSRLAHGAPPGSGGGSGGHGVAAGGGTWLASQVLAIGAAAFLAGSLVGAGSVIAMREQKERVVYVDRFVPPASAPPVAPVAPVAPLAPLATVAPSPVTAAARATAVPHRAAPSPAPVSSLLFRERSLLDAARSALSSGDSAGALSLLDEHARSFTRPQLGEEREALGVQALVTSGRYEEARARAARFRASAPDSLFLPAVDASLASIP